MSASPGAYQGYGYYSGLTQALAGQLRGEIEADRIDRQVAQNEYNRVLREAQLALDQQERAWNQGMRERELQHRIESSARGDDLARDRLAFQQENERNRLAQAAQAALDKASQPGQTESVLDRKRLADAQMDADEAEAAIERLMGSLADESRIEGGLRKGDLLPEREWDTDGPETTGEYLARHKARIDRSQRIHGQDPIIGVERLTPEETERRFQEGGRRKPAQGGMAEAESPKQRESKTIRDPKLRRLIAAHKAGKPLSSAEKKYLITAYRKMEK